jgi:hypothetical protein
MLCTKVHKYIHRSVKKVGILNVLLYNIVGRVYSRKKVEAGESCEKYCFSFIRLRSVPPSVTVFQSMSQKTLVT